MSPVFKPVARRSTEPYAIHVGLGGGWWRDDTDKHRVLVLTNQNDV